MEFFGKRCVLCIKMGQNSQNMFDKKASLSLSKLIRREKWRATNVNPKAARKTTM